MRERIFRDIEDERDRQEARFGPQRHSWPVWAAILGEETGEVAEACLHAHWGEGEGLDQLLPELIQVAAVAIQIVEKIDTGVHPDPVVRTGKAG